MQVKLTPFRLFIFNLAEKGPISAGAVVHAWCELNGHKPGVSSRRRFGFTSTAYQALYYLVKAGLLKKYNDTFTLNG